MISMPITGGFGNEMFQYAALRSKAEELGVQYACKKLLIDDLFELGDKNRVIGNSCEIPNNAFFLSRFRPGWCEDSHSILDSTVMGGAFESDKYFSSNIKKWFKFKPFVEKYAADYSKDIMVAATFDSSYDKKVYYKLPLSYYEQAIERVGRGRRAIIFSDYPGKAKKFFSGLDIDKIYIDHEDISTTKKALSKMDRHKEQIFKQFYLMTLCRDFVIPSSTFSWWGAYLGRAKDKRVVTPNPWFRVGDVENDSIYPKGWDKVYMNGQ